MARALDRMGETTMSTGDFYDKLRSEDAFLKSDYKRQWISHLKAGKLYRYLEPDLRGCWATIPPIMFIKHKPTNQLVFLDGDTLVQFRLWPERKPEDYWERVL